MRKAKLGEPPEAFQLPCDRFRAHAWSLSHFRFPVATTPDKKEKKVWNEAKSVVPLQCQKSKTRLATTKRKEFFKNSINN